VREQRCSLTNQPNFLNEFGVILSALNAPAPPLATAVVAARRVAKNGKGRLMSDEDADALITGARAAGQLLCWLPGFSKAGKSRGRYRVYSKARTWQQYDKMLTEKFISGETGTPRAKAVRSDLRNDVYSNRPVRRLRLRPNWPQLRAIL